MIPKIIHYCWFGEDEYSPLMKKCMDSWKKFCPNYQIMCWNEQNTDINYNRYLYEAYENKKWAFVSDIVRFMAVYEYGGIYLDTDVELLKSLDGVLYPEAFFGKEKSDRIATGLGFGAEPKHWIIYEMLEAYRNIHFLMSDGGFDETACPKRNTEVLRKIGMSEEDILQCINNIIIFPTEYFCPKKFESDEIKVTENTYSIHHYAASWMSLKRKARRFANRKYREMKKIVNESLE